MVRPTEESIARERPRLVRLCAALTGDAVLAEDLAQQTLLVGIAHVRQHRPIVDLPTWLGGIARTLCRHARTQRARQSWQGLDDDGSDSLPAPDDPFATLLAHERGTLLDRAFARMDAPARALLTARYDDDEPIARIADRLGVSVNAATLRLHRARALLQKQLAGDLRADAIAHGLLESDRNDETVLVCPRCGERRLHGRLDDDALALHCPQCDTDGKGLLSFSTHAASLPAAQVLGGARGYRVALRRVNAWWQTYLTGGLRTGIVRCIGCGKSVSVATSRQDNGAPGFTTRCPCGVPLYMHPAGLLLHTPEAQDFWRDSPRLRYGGATMLSCEGRPAVRVAFDDRQSRRRVAAVYALDDLTRLRLEKNG
jgi:RNA polymerase sigma-70 factor (ECF subfamily)